MDDELELEASGTKLSLLQGFSRFAVFSGSRGTGSDKSLSLFSFFRRLAKSSGENFTVL